MIRKYGFIGTIQMIYFKVRTLLLISNARIIRFPFDIRGKHHIHFGKNLTTGYWCRIEAFSEKNNKTLIFGDNVQLNDFVHITASKSVKIGNNVLLASKIYISDTIHGSYLGDINDSSPDTPPQERLLSFKDVVIKDNVWIGEFVSVLPGVTIGKGSIIGANSVVSKDIPDYVIAVGIPAKPIKKYNFELKKWEKI
jgi:acetyltransferase-like isoleucine patch superfamily enzyme